MSGVLLFARPAAAPAAERRPVPEGGATIAVLYDEPPLLIAVRCRRWASEPKPLVPDPNHSKRPRRGPRAP
jgi:hypothetical protein